MAEKWHAQSKRPYRVHRLRRSVRALVGMKKRNTTFTRKPDRYYRHFYVDRQTWEALCLLAAATHGSRMEMGKRVLRAGLSRIVGGAIADYNRQTAAMREEGLPAKPTPLMQQLIRLARSRGFNPYGLS